MIVSLLLMVNALHAMIVLQPQLGHTKLFVKRCYEETYRKLCLS